MYDAQADPYCYPGTTVLKNISGIRSQAELDTFELFASAQRADEPLPSGRFSVPHYQSVHRHLFQDVYSWAGKFRTVRIGKEGSAFCYPEHIKREMTALFADLKSKKYLSGLSSAAFAVEAAEFLATLNAIHPFREGNGRTQTTFFALLAERAGHPLSLDRLEAEPFMRAMIASFRGNTRLLASEIRRLIKAM
jgi:cell filamentation protein